MVKIVIHEDGIQELLRENKEIRDTLMHTGQAVASQMAATATEAEKGPGGTIDGYASAGFTAKWDSGGGRRPRVNVQSNAPIETAMKVFFHTIKTNGVDHLRAALYSVAGGPRRRKRR